VRRAGSSSIASLADLYAPIVDELGHCERVLDEELVSDQGFISDLCRHCSQFHGKLLRPALVLLSGRVCGGVTPAHHVLGAVVELVHLATLVHDDVLDEADIRRRAATVNRLWGNGRAVLMGDFIYSHAFHLCSSLESQFASRLIGQTAVTVCEGEMMQVAHRGNWDVSEDVYLDIITRKTAVLIEACCQLGAWAAKADDEAMAKLRTFGRSLGIAFQIADDLLDLTGDESEVGKSLGRDLTEGESTLPLIHHLSNLPGEQRDDLVARLSNGAVAQLVGEMPRRLRKTGSLQYARQVAEVHLEQARTALAGLPASPARDSLQAMTDFVIDRRR
jgi:octaprenyl-diphosphate synthase